MAVLPRNALIAGSVIFTLIGAFAPALRVLAQHWREATQFVWRVTRQADLSTLERRRYRSGHTRRARLRD